MLSMTRLVPLLLRAGTEIELATALSGPETKLKKGMALTFLGLIPGIKDSELR